MTQVTPVVTIDLAPLKKFRKKIESQLEKGTAGPISDAIKQWAYRYRGYAQERYDKFSKGGGNWEPLSPRTVKGRRKGKRKGKFGATSILRDTGTLFRVLTPTFNNTPGAIEERIPYGVRVGYGGTHSHGEFGWSSIADIASYHQEGTSFLPQREIIVEPTITVMKGMGEDMTRALKRLSNE